MSVFVVSCSSYMSSDTVIVISIVRTSAVCLSLQLHAIYNNVYMLNSRASAVAPGFLVRLYIYLHCTFGGAFAPGQTCRTTGRPAGHRPMVRVVAIRRGTARLATLSRGSAMLAKHRLCDVARISHSGVPANHHLPARKRSENAPESLIPQHRRQIRPSRLGGETARSLRSDGPKKVWVLPDAEQRSPRRGPSPRGESLPCRGHLK